MRQPKMSCVCGGAQFDDKDTLRNPTVIVEVLSPSTAAFDQGEKFQHQRTLASLQHYVLIEQSGIFVTHFEKIAGGLWAIVGTHTERDDVLALTLGGVSVAAPLSALYRRVSLEEQTSETEDEDSSK